MMLVTKSSSWWLLLIFSEGVFIFPLDNDQYILDGREKIETKHDNTSVE